MSEIGNELQEKHDRQVAWLRQHGHMHNRGGKEFPLQRGLFLLARLHGLGSIDTTCLGFDMEAGWATFKASVTGERGTYSAHGDATIKNVGKMVSPHFYRMAETRAVNRALRFYIGLNTTSFEELGPDDDRQESAPPPEAGPDTPVESKKKAAKPKKAKPKERGQGWHNAMDLLKEAVLDKGITMEDVNSKIRKQRNVDLIELDEGELEKVRSWIQSK